VRILYHSDRLSLRGGADQHLLQVITWAASSGHRVTAAAGRIESAVPVTVREWTAGRVGRGQDGGVE
jgi:hypothetical protein